MAPKPTTSRVRELAEAAARSAAGGNPLTRTRRRADTAEERVATLQAQRERLVRERDAARQQVETLRRQAETLREQRDRGRSATYAMSAVARALGLEDPADSRRLLQAVNQVRAESLVVEGLLHDQDLDEAVVRAVRGLLDTSQSISRARALCTALMDDERTRNGATVALGHYLLVWGSRRTAYEQFSTAPLDLVVRTAAVEAITSALHVDPVGGEALAERIVDHDRLSPHDAFAVAGVLVGYHRLGLARRALARARAAAPLEGVSEEEFQRLQHWLDTRPAELDALAPEPARPVLGIMQYDHPHFLRESINLGDYTQTVALLGHLLRRRGLRLHAADGDLQEALDTLRAGIPADLTLDTPGTDVDVVPVSRDASRWAALPRPTWTIAYGWYMRQVFRVRNDLPFHAAIRPIFLSFHVDRPKILTPDAVAYLRRHGPVGCRDWTTVDLLLSHGVDAFFSGCVTTTTHLTAGRRGVDRPVPATDAVGLVDVLDDPGNAGDAALTQIRPELRGRRFAANLLAAHERHRVFGDSFASLRTSRLHVYLPATSMGVPVSFEPKNPADVRFEGLAGLTPGSPELREIQDRISELLDLVLGLITSGAGEEDVYAAWRERTAPLVAQARERRERWRTSNLPVESLAGAAAPVRDSAVHLGEGGDVHVAIALDQNLVDAAPVVLQGIDENTTRDVRVHVLTRGVPTTTVEAWSRTFPRLRFSHYRFDDVEYGSIARLLAHTTVSTMDRLLLPDVLSSLRRAVYIDIDVAVLGDVGELWDLDLAGAPLAARPTVSEWAESGLSFIYRAAQRLPVDIARELRSYMHARISGDFTAFNAGILVLDLARMRSDGFTEHFAGMAGRYGLNDQDVLCCYAGAVARPLDPRWNAFPTREPLPEGVRLVHYAGGAKPWQDLPVPAKELWRSTRERYLSRTAEPVPVGW
jgi:lipopolysaccharide biosynthesis glycosyltransferase